MEKKDYKSLTEDDIIPSQRFSLISFAEPLNHSLLERKESFFSKNFITSYLNDRVKTLEYTKKKDVEITDEMQDYIEKDIKLETIGKLYNNFREQHFDELNNRFNKKYNNKDELILSAYKIRGSYPTVEEATKRAHELKESDSTFHIFLAEVGKWIPYIPVNKEKIKDTEYDDQMLATIVKGNIHKKELNDLEFQERKNKSVYKMNEDTKKKKEKLKAIMEGNEEEEEEDKLIDKIEITLGDDDVESDKEEEDEEEVIEATETIIGRDEVVVSNKTKKFKKNKFKRKQNNRRKVNRRRR